MEYSLYNFCKTENQTGSYLIKEKTSIQIEKTLFPVSSTPRPVYYQFSDNGGMINILYRASKTFCYSSHKSINYTRNVNSGRLKMIIFASVKKVMSESSHSFSIISI